MSDTKTDEPKKSDILPVFQQPIWVCACGAMLSKREWLRNSQNQLTGEVRLSCPTERCGNHRKLIVVKMPAVAAEDIRVE